MAEETGKKLFEEFPPVAIESWETKIKQDLKGEDYFKKLVWETIEGFKIKPYYTSEDLSDLEYLNTFPDEFPFIRGNRKAKNHWEIQQDIRVENVERANEKAQRAISRGATSIAFEIKPDSITTQDDFSHLLNNIPLENIRVNFQTETEPVKILAFLKTEIKARKISGKNLTGSLEYDPLSYLATTGSFYPSEEEVFLISKELLEKRNKNFPNYRMLAVNGKHYHNAGASTVQEIAVSLALGNEYLSRLTEMGLSIENIGPAIQFNLAVGSNYFMEIAKLRVTRMLWAKITEAYGPLSHDSSKIYIHSITSDWNKTIYNPYVNMLRHTTESMSSVIGGTDSLTVKPFDSTFRNSDRFSERIARNIQLILKEEAYFNKVTDPGAGSYYIESLTDSIAAEVWKLFLTIEDKGGFIEAFKAGFIQKEIEETAAKKDKQIAICTKTLIGTNQFPDFNETIKPDIDLNRIKSKYSIPKNAVARPLKLYRGAEEFEKIRLKTEDFVGKKPVVYLLTYGNLALRKARATFSSNFFACAGFNIIEGQGFPTVNECVRDCLNHKPEIVVICSSDEEYQQIVPLIYSSLKGKAIIVIAGFPVKLVDEFKKVGLKYFIHKKSNVLETLKGFQKELGMK